MYILERTIQVKTTNSSVYYKFQFKTRSKVSIFNLENWTCSETWATDDNSEELDSNNAWASMEEHKGIST